MYGCDGECTAVRRDGLLEAARLACKADKGRDGAREGIKELCCGHWGLLQVGSLLVKDLRHLVRSEMPEVAEERVGVLQINIVWRP